MSAAVPEALARLASCGALAPIDVHFAEAVARLSGSDDDALVLGAAVASHAVGQGHVCADLAAIVREPPYDREGDPVADFAWPALDAWVAALQRAPFVTGGDEPRPLVLDGTRLYLARYFRYERELALALMRRAAGEPPPVDEALLDAGLAALFPEADGREAEQARAARAAVTGRIAIISGGPGTGKTTTVARVLALLVEQAHTAGKERLGVELLAPTGKAAQRLGEALASSLDKLPLSPEIAAAIPREAATIHRRLGFAFDDPTRFRHHADNPLDADVVLVDEASMVDLALMARLVDAVPESARLILLGDRDQLASVEAGAIFGDVCLAGSSEDSVLRPATVHLTHRFRFDEDSPIGQLAEAIRDGDAARALALLRPTDAGDALMADLPDEPDEPVDDAPLFAAMSAPTPPARVRRLSPPAAGSPVSPVAREIVEGYRALLEATTPERALKRISEFRVLCAHRRGRFGAERIGRDIERLLVDAGLLPASRRYGRATDEWYPGRLVMVTSNDYQLDLFNGDVGIALASPGDPDRLRVWFAAADGLRDVQPARLPPHESAFAMTIHKSQGSEFGGVVIVMPGKPSPIGTRELLYTAVTRARRDATIVGTEEVVANAVERRIVRASGLGALLVGA